MKWPNGSVTRQMTPAIAGQEVERSCRVARVLLACRKPSRAPFAHMVLYSRHECSRYCPDGSTHHRQIQVRTRFMSNDK